jgi:hypothetical protein
VTDVQEKIGIAPEERIQGGIYDYNELMLKNIFLPERGMKQFHGICPSWDNTARRADRGVSWINSSPEKYYKWLKAIVSKTRETHVGDERLIFINAWNEWAEGCHLEPDRRYGRAFLEATRNAKQGLRRYAGFPHTDLPRAEDTLPPRRFWPELGFMLQYHLMLHFGNLKLAFNRSPLLLSLLLPLVRAGERSLFEALFAKFARVSVATARRCLYEQGGRALAVACKGCHVEKDLFTELFIAIRQLGDATGGALAASIIKAAVVTHNNMATFEQAQVSRGQV